MSVKKYKSNTSNRKVYPSKSPTNNSLANKSLTSKSLAKFYVLDVKVRVGFEFKFCNIVFPTRVV